MTTRERIEAFILCMLLGFCIAELVRRVFL